MILKLIVNALQHFLQQKDLTFYTLYRNTASETVKQKLVFAGTEEGKLLALRQSFAEVSSLI